MVEFWVVVNSLSGAYPDSADSEAPKYVPSKTVTQNIVNKMAIG